MNTIDIKEIRIPSGYENRVFFIDGKPLYEYFEEWLPDNSEFMKRLTPLDCFAICWTDKYDNEGDARFMRFVLNQRQAITPILSCPDDFDFSCLVIVVDVIMQKKTVIWKRIGIVDHSKEDGEEERLSGILDLEKYTDEDWELYGDNIALAKVDSKEWFEWIGLRIAILSLKEKIIFI
ncbi:hypothetical protein [Butyrivibrio sp. NC2007]|uniref:hypothetical protein n=1 Tax=Butyrivibrio sp. NC2007 TaxID=1280683 RepID=UPI0003B3F52A|nr:hypothetical protein [Butyrivibrio sp. NC2007]